MTKPTKQRLAWVAAVECEGGPAMVADLPSFAQWTGGIPFSELSAMDPLRKEHFENRMTTLHYWGQFTDELPAPFAAEGGHQFIACASEADARAKLVELRDAVKKKFPKLEIAEEEDRIHFVRPDDDAELLAELSPASEYDASWQANENAESWTHAFGKNAQALFWDLEGDGVADVGVTADGTELVLVRSWLSGEDETEDEEVSAIHALVDSKTEDEEPAGEIVLSSDKVVIIWAQVPPVMLEGVAEVMDLGEGELPRTLDTEPMSEVGVVLRMKPGRYAVSLATTDDDDDDEDEEDGEDGPWSCRWCRLTWVGEA